MQTAESSSAPGRDLAGRRICDPAALSGLFPRPQPTGDGRERNGRAHARPPRSFIRASTASRSGMAGMAPRFSTQQEAAAQAKRPGSGRPRSRAYRYAPQKLSPAPVASTARAGKAGSATPSRMAPSVNIHSLVTKCLIEHLNN